MVIKGESSTRENFPRCVSEPLAILSITLQGLADNGPSRLTFEHLVPYLCGNTCYINVDFNFGSIPEIQSFYERFETLADLFESGELQRWANNEYVIVTAKIPPRFRRFFVFLGTHSDPLRGDLHITPGNQFSATAEQVKPSSLNFAYENYNEAIGHRFFNGSFTIHDLESSLRRAVIACLL